MSYVKTNWQNEVTPLNATNLNKIEDELSTLEQDKVDKSSVVTDYDVPADDQIPSLTLFDYAMQIMYGGISDKIDKTSIQTSVSSASTDAQVPSAKLFYDTCGNIEATLNAIRGGERMSIGSALAALQADITNARTAITTKGGTVTAGGGSSQLAGDIATIPGGAEPYTGEYVVTPDFSEQTLSTEGKIMTDDITVHQISVSEVANPSGGNTLTI